MNSFLDSLKSLWRSAFHREEVFTERATIRSGVTINHEKVAFSGTDKFKHALVNALLMFAITAGTTGAFASAFEVEYNAPLLFAMYAVFALIFSLMNCNRTWQNIGYILFFILFTFFLITFRQFVNSGLNGFLNDFYEYLSDAWNMDVTKTYNEQFEEQHYMTITMLFFTVGVAVMLLINFVFNNEQSPLTVFILALPFLAFGLYFDAIPDTISFILIAFALICCSVFRHNNQFTLPSKKKTFHRHHFKKSHVYVHYSNGRVVAQTAAIVLGFVLIFSSLASLLYPSDSYTANSSLIALKDSTESTVREILLYGFRSYLNDEGSSSAGGLSNGSLGNTGTVTNDYDTDLIVTFAPYSYDTVYLKTWVGTTYTGNSWDNVLSNSYYDENGELVTEDLEAEATMLSELFGTDSSVLKGKMTVEIADTFIGINLLTYPYYTVFNSDYFDINSTVSRSAFYTGIERTKEFEYYVYQDIWNSDYVNLPITTAYDEYVHENYTSVYGTIGATAMSVSVTDLTVDEANVEGQLKALCEEQGFGGTTAEVISQIQDYLEANYTYSLNPGKLPDGKDFVTYFLFENPYGYCSYFATAGTLLLRAMGIPARYVEGYVVSMSDVVDSTILEDENYEDWLEGDANIGQTAVVEVEVDDSRAHAWCEVYLNGYGWVPVEFTVAGTEDEADTDYWNLWSNLMSSTADDDTTNALAAIMGTNVGQAFSYIGRVLLAALIVAAVILAIRYYRNYQAYLAGKRSFYSGYNAKVLKEYQKLCHTVKKKGLSDTENLTVTEAMDILKGAGIETGTLTRMKEIYQTAAYSPENISEDKYKEWREIISSLSSPSSYPN